MFPAHEPLVASLLVVVRPGAPSSFLLLVAMPGALSSVLFQSVSVLVLGVSRPEGTPSALLLPSVLLPPAAGNR